MFHSRRSFISTPLLGAILDEPLTRLLSGHPGTEPDDLVFRPGGKDDSDQIQQLLEEAGKRGGSVLLKSGSEPYRLDHAVKVPDHASLVGESPGTRLVAVRQMEAMIEIDAPPPLGNRLGTVTNLVLDGNRMASAGIVTEACVQRWFAALTIINCREAGLRIVGSQNNLFVGVDVEYNGVAVANTKHGGLELLGGAGNNCFVRCEFNRNGGYQAMITGKGTPPGAFEVGPSSNLFLGCIFERQQPNTNAAIHAGNGRMNTWLRCDIAHDGPVMIDGPTDSAAVCSLWRFSACVFSGSPKTTFLRGGSRVWGWVFDGCLFENFERISEPTSFRRIALLSGNQVSNVTEWNREADTLVPPTTIPDGRWDTQHLVLGNAHIWVDPQGALRYNTRAPKDPYDGGKVSVESR